VANIIQLDEEKFADLSKTHVSSQGCHFWSVQKDPQRFAFLLRKKTRQTSESVDLRFLAVSWTRPGRLPRPLSEFFCVFKTKVPNGSILLEI
jgi:hypothetical protein